MPFLNSRRVQGYRINKGRGRRSSLGSIYSLPAEERAATWDLGSNSETSEKCRPGLSWTHSHFSGARETYFLSGLPSPGQPWLATHSKSKSWALRSAQNAVCVRFGPRYFVIPLADTICSARGGVGEDDYFKSWVPGGCCLSGNHSTSEHAQCWVSFWYLHTRKRMSTEKSSSFAPPPPQRKLTSTFTKLASWPTWAGHLCVASQPGAERGVGCGDPSPPADTPGGAERGLMGKGAAATWVEAQTTEPGHPSISAWLRAPPPTPAPSPKWIIPPKINKSIQLLQERGSVGSHTWRLICDSLQNGSPWKYSREVSHDLLGRCLLGRKTTPRASTLTSVNYIYEWHAVELPQCTPVWLQTARTDLENGQPPGLKTLSAFI